MWIIITQYLISFFFFLKGGDAWRQRFLVFVQRMLCQFHPASAPSVCIIFVFFMCIGFQKWSQILSHLWVARVYMVAYISFGHPVWGISFNALQWIVMRSSTFFPANTWKYLKTLKLRILQLFDSKLIWHKTQRTEIIRYFEIGFSFSVDRCASRCEKLLTSKHNSLNLLTQ